MHMRLNAVAKLSSWHDIAQKNGAVRTQFSKSLMRRNRGKPRDGACLHGAGYVCNYGVVVCCGSRCGVLFTHLSEVLQRSVLPCCLSDALLRYRWAEWAQAMAWTRRAKPTFPRNTRRTPRIRIVPSPPGGRGSSPGLRRGRRQENLLRQPIIPTRVDKIARMAQAFLTTAPASS